MPLHSRSYSISRRRFLKLMAIAVGGVVTGGGVFRGRSILSQPRADVMVLEASAYSEDLVDLLLRGIREFTGFCERCRGSSVLLKPNLVEFHPDRPVNTHPALVIAAVEAFRALGAREVVVGEGPGHQRDVELLLEYSGLGEALRDVKAPFVDLNLDAIAPVPLQINHTGLGRLFLPRTVLGADIIVSMPKLKTHKWTGVTLSMKNMFGVVPGVKYGWPKNPLHWCGIDASIVDVNLAVNPAFSIVDGIVAMEGNGPIDGTAVNAGVVVLGDSLSAVDATAARLMGIYPERIGHLMRMTQEGGSMASERISQIGEPIAKLKREFRVADHLRSVTESVSPLAWLLGS